MKKTKRKYEKPNINKMAIDSEISLIMASYPDSGDNHHNWHKPNNGHNHEYEHHNKPDYGNDYQPFKQSPFN